jgi:hypothetical protein
MSLIKASKIGKICITVFTGLIALALILLPCTGCKPTKIEYENMTEAPKMMTVVDSTAGYTIYKHDETGVHYFCRDSGYGKSVCVMLNADGTPYTGNEEG